MELKDKTRCEKGMLRGNVRRTYLPIDTHAVLAKVGHVRSL